MFVCVCNAVTDHEIRDHAARGVETLDELRALNGCSDCCGQCADEAEAILHSARLAVTPPVAVLPFAKTA
ncbi:MAG: (2Fe-2S)-binding protein [Wenzhouxiangellaceae bacterium]|nr:(2Fe-2S)-binding protein [Wenzhouxiangellaceae bacterium]